MTEPLKGKAVKGIFWSSVDRFSVQGMQFVLMLILARMLNPSDYGMIGMLAVFLAISQSIIDGGFANALIRKKDRSEIDYSTVFYFNIVVGIVLMVLLYIAAPFIASFYEMPKLEPVTKVLSIVLFFKSCAVVPVAKLTVSLNFKTQTKASLSSVIIGGVLGILAAFYGFGVWALVIQAVSNAFINSFLLLLLSKWKPLFTFSIDSFKNLFNYGSKLLLSSLIDITYRNIYPIVIGKKFEATALGYYTRADQFAQLPSANITGIIQRVTFPLLSELQDDEAKLKNVYTRLLRLSAYVIFPLMLGLAALSKPLVLFLLTEKWLAMVLMLKILCLAQMWYPIHALNLNLLQVKGFSNIFLKLEIIKKIVGIGILIITIPMGIIPMCIGSVISSLISLFINTYYTGKIINFGFLRQIKSLLPALFYSFSMGVIVFYSLSFFSTPIVQLIFGLLFGVTYYILISILTKSQDLKEIKQLIISKKKHE